MSWNGTLYPASGTGQRMWICEEREEAEASCVEYLASAQTESGGPQASQGTT